MRFFSTLLSAKLQTSWGTLQGVVENVTQQHAVSYVIEPINWAIKAVGEEVVAALKVDGRLTARLTSTSIGLRRTIIHFGSVNTMIGTMRHGAVPHTSNKVAVTIFHVLPHDPRYGHLRPIGHAADVIHTASQGTRAALINAGIPAHKIVAIPLGVDRRIFYPISSVEKRGVREKLRIPRDAFVVGSFQKDGDGWGLGLKPKHEKGPDVLVSVLKRLQAKYKLFVVLVGPARGYVERALREHRVPFKSFGYHSALLSIVPFYHALDSYLLTSRTEGGPRQLFECWATGVPIVTTSVGMVPDVAAHNHNALIAPPDDVAALTHYLERLIIEPVLRQKITQTALQSVARYDWRVLIQAYYDKLYQPLL